MRKDLEKYRVPFISFDTWELMQDDLEVWGMKDWEDIVDPMEQWSIATDSEYKDINSIQGYTIFQYQLRWKLERIANPHAKLHYVLPFLNQLEDQLFDDLKYIPDDFQRKRRIKRYKYKRSLLYNILFDVLSRDSISLSNSICDENNTIIDNDLLDKRKEREGKFCIGTLRCKQKVSRDFLVSMFRILGYDSEPIQKYLSYFQLENDNVDGLFYERPRIPWLSSLKKIELCRILTNIVEGADTIVGIRQALIFFRILGSKNSISRKELNDDIIYGRDERFSSPELRNLFSNFFRKDI